MKKDKKTKPRDWVKEQKEFEKMMEEIRPYLKETKFKIVSTTGKWEIAGKRK
ncbi:MAG: hypothetical protein JXR73_05960 [Candidatus Omnitrophica bacterium]|nr:hypothetical protein [Candidatus Omnitrophota bacterium]